MKNIESTKWTILEFSHKDEKSRKYYICRCACGLIKTLRSSSISNQCKSCSIKQLNFRKNISGTTVGSWCVGDLVKNENRNEWEYKCTCSCGTKRNIPRHQLISKKTTKCHRCRVKTHGMTYTDTFKIWRGILRRCLNKNFKHYKYYGGRGIKIAERWLSFDNFYKDMGDRPAGLQIDRIDNNGNYEPGNCRWVTAAINNSNRNIVKRRIDKYAISSIRPLVL